MSFRLACLLAAAITLSCSPRRSDMSPLPRPLPPLLLLEEVAKRNMEVQTVTGRGNLTFDSPEIAGSAFFRSSLKRPDSLLVRLQGPFGLDVGTFFLSRTRYVVYNAIENVVQSGDPSSTSIRSIIPFDLTPEDLVSVFSGMFPLPRDTAGVRIAGVDGDVTRLTAGCGGGECEYWVDTDRLAVTRVRRKDAAGKTEVEMEATDFKEFDGFAIPRQIRLDFPGASRTVSVFYTTLAPNGEPPSFAFTVPPGARVRRP